jgi:tryptophan synthase alpha chain
VSRLAKVFNELQQAGRKAVVPYIVAGDPNLSATVPLMHSLVAAGANVIEVGVPFSDPMSEGPVIQKAHERALAVGTSLRATLALVAEFRQTDSDTPVVMMGYANPIERMGYRVFADLCAESGVDGLITVDLPPEEVDTVNVELKRVGIDNIFLISPTTPDDRIEMITSRASGFLYYVAVKGVTGSGALDPREVSRYLDKIRRVSKLPVAVGFGIKDASSAASIAEYADGVVVGSALVDALAAAAAAGASQAELEQVATRLISDIRTGVDGVASAA